MIPTPRSFHKVRYKKEEKNVFPKCGYLPPQQDSGPSFGLKPEDSQHMVGRPMAFCSSPRRVSQLSSLV